MISKSIDLQVKKETERLICLGVIYKIIKPKYKFIKGIFKKVGTQSYIAVKIGERFYYTVDSYPNYIKCTTKPLEVKKYVFDIRDMAELLDISCMLDDMVERR